MKKQLNEIKLYIDDNCFLASKIYEEYKYIFVIDGVRFISDNEHDLSLFQGYYYDVLDCIDLDKIQMFLDFVKDVIANENDEVYEYILNWCAFMFQNPGKKTLVSIMLKGLQGSGKNSFTNILCDLLKEYATKNITDINEIAGTFNSVIEGKMLLVVNEAKNIVDDKSSNSNPLKSVISDNDFRLNEKYIPSRDAENVANVIIITNNARPIKVENSDRRYLITYCNGKYLKNKHYFDSFYDKVDKEFFDNLLTFFIKRDISGVNIQNIPMTKEKDFMIDASQNPIDSFICDHYDELVKGMICRDVFMLKPHDINMKTFQLYLSERCQHLRVRINGVREYMYRLKNDCLQIYHQSINYFEPVNEIDENWVSDEEIQTVDVI